MQKPDIHIKESERLQSLKSYMVLDTESEEEIDNLTQLASDIFETPITLVSLVDKDRQWFKSKVGLDANETSRDLAFCAHAINQTNDVFIIDDARTDVRFSDNPLVTGEPHVIFYAGAILKSDEGLPLGTFCLIDHVPRKLSDKQIGLLKIIAKQIMHLLNYKKSIRKQEELERILTEKNNQLNNFASIAAHDLKSPLLNIIGASKLITMKYASELNPKGVILLDGIEKSSQRLKLLIDRLLEFSKIDNPRLIPKSKVNLKKSTEDLANLIGNEDTIKITLISELVSIDTYSLLLEQLLLNLFSNSLKYSDKKIAEIELYISENSSHYLFVVKDNGPGIDKKYQDKIFNLFQTASITDKYGNKGTGIGLSIVKKITEQLGGNIHLVSDAGQGAEFHFSISK